MKNWKNCFWQFWPQRVPPLGKNQKCPSNFFFTKNHTFSFWICIVNVVSFLLRYITFKYSNFSNFDLYVLKILFFANMFQQSDWIIVHKLVFLVSLNSWRSEKWDASQVWALGHLLTASEWLESILGHIGPALAINGIPETSRNRVKVCFESELWF